MCSNLFFRFVNVGFFLIFFYVPIYIYVCVCVCVCKVSNKAFFPPLSTRFLCLVVSISLVC